MPISAATTTKQPVNRTDKQKNRIPRKRDGVSFALCRVTVIFSLLIFLVSNSAYAQEWILRLQTPGFVSMHAPGEDTEDETAGASYLVPVSLSSGCVLYDHWSLELEGEFWIGWTGFTGLGLVMAGYRFLDPGSFVRPFIRTGGGFGPASARVYESYRDIGPGHVLVGTGVMGRVTDWLSWVIDFRVMIEFPQNSVAYSFVLLPGFEAVLGRTE